MAERQMTPLGGVQWGCGKPRITAKNANQVKHLRHKPPLPARVLRA